MTCGANWQAPCPDVIRRKAKVIQSLPEGHNVDPHAPHSLNPVFAIRSAVKHRRLILEMVRRDVIGRYRGSVMGLLWSFFTPVLMLAVYTFVFSVVFKARWAGGSDSKTEFAIVLFVGLMVFNLFSECLSRAPNLVLSNPNFVKKVIFPLEILPFVSLGSAGLFFEALSGRPGTRFGSSLNER